MHEETNWHFDFGLSAKNDGKLVSEKECQELIDAIIDHVEANGLCIGGGFRPYAEEELA